MVDKTRLQQQIDFIVEIDKVKHVFRQTLLINGTRNENDAEHSWHLAIMALILSEHVADKLNLLRVIKMVLLHDVVEIDAGDTFCYDQREDKLTEEQKAADRIFGILPPDQAQEFQSLWQEFEERRTPEACFAASLDRLQPLLHNYFTNGHTWRKYNIRKEQVLERNKVIEHSSPILWGLAQQIIDEAFQELEEEP